MLTKRVCRCIVYELKYICGSALQSKGSDPMLKTIELFDLNRSMAGPWLSGFAYPWQALQGISGLIRELGQTLGDDYLSIGPEVWAHKTAVVAPSASITGPCIIGAGSEVRHCAFIRGSVLVGENCVVGNSTEVKNVILFDRVQVPHFNYVGDSILGYKAHMGCGAVTSNIKSDRTNVTIRTSEGRVDTGLIKFGAMLGDYSEVGCNAVLNPGTVLGRNCTVYPTSCVRGYVEENSIWKNDGTVVRKV